jgi:hypothetical protein
VVLRAIYFLERDICVSVYLVLGIVSESYEIQMPKLYSVIVGGVYKYMCIIEIGVATLVIGFILKDSQAVCDRLWNTNHTGRTF